MYPISKILLDTPAAGGFTVGLRKHRLSALPWRLEWKDIMYRIGAFSKFGKTTGKTLRHYDEVGLLKPALVDGENGYRYYTTSQLTALHEIVALRQMGFSVAETLSIVDGHNVAKILSQRRA